MSYKGDLNIIQDKSIVGKITALVAPLATGVYNSGEGQSLLFASSIVLTGNQIIHGLLIRGNVGSKRH
jgi:hypothetical protein